MSLTTWEINGVSLELDLGDADVMERYETAFAEMEASEKMLPKDGKASDMIRAYCGVFRELFDKLFGEGTADRLFKGVATSAAAYEEIYYSFINFAQDQLDKAAIQRAERMSKYKPNRQQRRTAARQKKK